MRIQYFFIGFVVMEGFAAPREVAPGRGVAFGIRATFRGRGPMPQKGDSGPFIFLPGGQPQVARIGAF